MSDEAARRMGREKKRGFPFVVRPRFRSFYSALAKQTAMQLQRRDLWFEQQFIL